tara:strand:+ start:2693 stop:4402 length:1710 start_codon:yes stop_codon:yes gene_type:complete
MRVKNTLVSSLISNRGLDKEEKKIYLSNNFIDLEKLQSFDKSFIRESQWLSNKFKGKNSILKIYKKILNQLSQDLNKFHGTKFSKNFWEMILGPWCITFLDKYLENFHGINEINYKNILYKYVDYNKNTFTPFDNKEFIIFNSSHYWQNYITKIVIDDHFKKKIILKKIKKKIVFDYSSMNNLYYYNSFISKINLFFLKFSKILILNIPMSKITKIKFFLRLGHLGKIFFQNHYKIKKISRQKFIQKFKCNNKGLDNNIYNRALENIPTMAVENFIELVSIIDKKFQKIQPSKIFLTTGNIGNTEQLFFCALKKEFGSKLIINQHGGRYNMLNKNWFEEYEKKICDNFICWGLRGKKTAKTNYLGYPNKKLSQNLNSSNLLVALSPKNDFELFSYNRNSIINKSFFYSLNYDFINKLDQNISEKLFFRFKKNSRNYNSFYFTKKNLSSIKLDKYKNFSDSINNAKLVVTNFTSTVALETITSNIPTILISDLNENCYNKKTKTLIKLLKKNNLYFEDFHNATIFINKNWDKIEYWWMLKKNQKTIDNFKKNYCYYDENYSTKLFKFLKN